MKWVEKASFVRLNKLFEINANEGTTKSSFLNRNLLAVIREPQPYILLIIPRQLPKVVVSGEHFILKYLSFYKEVHETDSKAC